MTEKWGYVLVVTSIYLKLGVSLGCKSSRIMTMYNVPYTYRVLSTCTFPPIIDGLHLLPDKGGLFRRAARRVTSLSRRYCLSNTQSGLVVRRLGGRKFPKTVGLTFTCTIIILQLSLKIPASKLLVTAS